LSFDAAQLAGKKERQKKTDRYPIGKADVKVDYINSFLTQNEPMRMQRQPDKMTDN
jgi:hypothetical protein